MSFGVKLTLGIITCVGILLIVLGYDDGHGFSFLVTNLNQSFVRIGIILIGNCGIVALVGFLSQARTKW